MASWDPMQYEKFIRNRTQPAVDLANRLGELEPASVLDLGCGPGNSTKVLIDKFPGARVVGADNSEEMLERARSLYPGTEFIRLDAGGDLREAGGTFDVVFSNACLQWLPDHRTLLPRLTTLLNPDGVLAVQIPMQSEHPVHTLINRLIAAQKWKNRLARRFFNTLTAEEYFDILAGISNDFEIWETVYCHIMPDIESIIEWYKGTGLRPYLDQLSDADAEEFINDIREGLQKMYVRRSTGEILFRFPRLFFTVRRTGSSQSAV